MITRLSRNFTLQELIESNTVNKRNNDANPDNDIDNTPSVEEINNLGRLARTVLQPIRDSVGRALIVSSGFRCDELNKAVGGSPTSDHKKGLAADINAEGMTNDELFEHIINIPAIQYGQCILEDLDGKEWVHISYGIKKQNLRTNGRDAAGKIIYITVPKAQGA